MKQVYYKLQEGDNPFLKDYISAWVYDRWKKSRRDKHSGLFSLSSLCRYQKLNILGHKKFPVCTPVNQDESQVHETFNIASMLKLWYRPRIYWLQIARFKAIY